MLDQSNDFDYGLPPADVALLVVVLLALSLLIGAATAVITGLTIYETMSIIGVLASIALSAILAYLYYRMSRIQDLQRQESVRQADLQQELTKQQEQQNELMGLQQEMQELEYQPRIFIERFELTQTGVKITLRNLGRGLAEHITIRPSLRVDDDTAAPSSDGESIFYNPEDVFYRDPDTGDEYVPQTITCTRADTDDLLSEDRRGGMLSPGEGAVTFEAGITFGEVDRVHDGVSGVFAERLFDRLYEQGVREVTFLLDLVYCDELGDVSVLPVMGRRGELKPDMGVEDIESLQYGVSGTRTEVVETIESLGDYPPP